MLHSKHKLSIDDKIVLERTLEYILFSCRSNFKDVKPLNYPSDSPQTKSLFERVFVKENLNSEMPMEVTYYEDICVLCACNKILILTTGVYLICSFCLEYGKQKILKRKRPLYDESKALTKGKKTKLQLNGMNTCESYNKLHDIVVIAQITYTCRLLAQ